MFYFRIPENAGVFTVAFKTPREAIDAKAVFERAIAGESVASQSCDAPSVARHFELGKALDIRGTPATFTGSGKYISRY